MVELVGKDPFIFDIVKFILKVAVPFVPVAGRFPPRTGLQDKEERKPAGSQERPREAPRQGAPREGPKLDFMELAV